MAQASTITLQDVKQALRQTQNYDDALIGRLLRSAIQECLRFTNRTELPTLPLEYPQNGYDVDSDGLLVIISPSEEIPSSEDPVADDVVNGVILLVQQDYSGEPGNREAVRKAAENLWYPYRTNMGVY